MLQPHPQTPEPAASPANPVFDEVRRERTDDVIAGRAAPVARVSVHQQRGRGRQARKPDRSGNSPPLPFFAADGGAKILSPNRDADGGHRRLD